MNTGRAMCALAILMMLIITGFSASGLTIMCDGMDPPIADSVFPGSTGDTNWIVQEVDTPAGTTYLLHEHFGGFWSDAEKVPSDDGTGNPAPDNPGEEDDLLCWAATASNMMEWTGWGVAGGMTENDEFLDFYEDHVTDWGSYVQYGIEWWFNGNLPCPDPTSWSQEDVDVDGFHTHDWSSYTRTTGGGQDLLPYLRTWLTSGFATGLHIYPISGPGGHTITCWGVNTNESKDPVSEWDEYYLGIWVTDSDSHKGMADAPDVLRYYEVEWDTVNACWKMPSYGGWKIGGAVGLEPYPGESRPVANAGTSYTGLEGQPIVFFAGASSDDDPLLYRWDFDADGNWDTAWSSNTAAMWTWHDDYTGNVYLEVTDGRMRDMSITTVTVNNVAPSVILVGDALYEGETATVSVSITDPSPTDSFQATIEWGEGEPEVYDFDEGTINFSKSHLYDDDDPTATPWDEYTFRITLVDDDGGTEIEATTITVYNVIPSLSMTIAQPNPLVIMPGIHELELQGDFTDPSARDSHSFVLDWGDGTILEGTVLSTEARELVATHTYGESGSYEVVLTITDDDGGVNHVAITVEVATVDESMDAMGDYLDGLDSSSFSRNSVSRRDALVRHLDTISNMVDRGRTDMAIRMIQSAFMVTPSGHIGPILRDTWIVDPTVSEQVNQMALDLILLIQMES